MTLKIFGGRFEFVQEFSTFLIGVLLLASVSRSLGEESLPRPLPQGGWSTPSPVGWTNPVLLSSIIEMSGSVVASGQGSAGGSHAESVAAVGGRHERAVKEAMNFFYLGRDP